MLKRIALLGLMVTLGAALAVPAFAANAIQGAVGNIDAATNANIAGSAACRVWSLQSLGINNNFGGTCLNNCCFRPYNTSPSLSPGGYICQGENTAAYANDADNQIFYELIDAQVFAGACNHAAFFAVQGQIARNAVLDNPGDFRTDGCPGASAVNCFERASTPDARTVPLSNVNQGYPPNPHSIPSIGGLSPVPNVRVAFPGGGCPAGDARLTWDDPETYAATMKNGVASPVKGVTLYSNCSSCSACPTGDLAGGWVPLGQFPLGAGAQGSCVPKTCGLGTWFALRVRLVGPNDSTNEVESGCGYVGTNSQCWNSEVTAVRIANLSARYAGRGTVNVNFTTGIEGGVQGYYVTRGSSPNGPFTRVSQQLSPRGDGSAYTFSDKVRSAFGRTLYYSVEIVNADGTTESSGTSAVNLPAGKRKLGAQ